MVFSKVVAAAVSPLGVALAVGLLATVQVLRRRRRAAWLVIAAFGWLWVWAAPLTSDALRGWLERQAGPRDVAKVRAAPVAVVLGDGMGGIRSAKRPYPNLTQAADRMWHAARLHQAGKVQHLVLSGGTTRPGEPSEARSMQQFLLALGVPEQAMWLEEASTNTATNAERTAELLRAKQVREVVLVTSALHMRRARAQFERVGLVVHPAPTDIEVVPQPFGLLRVLPDAGALEGSARAFKEVVGYWVGR